MSTHIFKQLHESQFSFRPKRLKTFQMLKYLDGVYSLLEEDEESPIFAVYTDLVKTFDKVEHSFLFTRLSSSGIGDNLIELLKSYLQNRKQSARIKNQLSNWLDVTSGVLQGSTLGPLLFLCFIKDLPRGLKSSCVGYADDYKLLLINPKDLQTDMNHLNKWCCVTNRSCSISKCQNLIFKSDCTSHKNYIGEYELSEPDTQKGL